MATRGSDLTSAQRREKAVALRILGQSYQKIGEMLGVSKVAAFKMVQKELARARAKTEEDVAALREVDLQRLDQILAAMMPAAVKPNNPDVQVIDRVLKVMERRAKMLGTDAPEKIAPTDPTGTRPAFDHYEKANAQLAELRRMVEQRIAGLLAGGAAPNRAGPTGV